MVSLCQVHIGYRVDCCRNILNGLLMPGAHWLQSRLLPKHLEWSPYARCTLVTESTVAETGDKSATKSTVTDTVNFVADMVDFVAGFGDKSATT